MAASSTATLPNERVTGRREATLVALLLGPVALTQIVGLLFALRVLLTGAELAAATQRVTEEATVLVQRVHDAAPLVEELDAQGIDATSLRHGLGTLETTTKSSEKAQAAISFVADAHRLAEPLAGRDDHDARLVRQRLARLVDARETLAEVERACTALMERTTGRWARRFGVTGAACQSMGEP